MNSKVLKVGSAGFDTCAVAALTKAHTYHRMTSRDIGALGLLVRAGCSNQEIMEQLTWFTSATAVSVTVSNLRKTMPDKFPVRQKGAAKRIVDDASIEEGEKEAEIMLARIRAKHKTH